MAASGGSYVDNAMVKAVTWTFHGLNLDFGDALWKWFSKLFMAPTAVINDPLVLRLNFVLAALALAIMPVMIVGAVLRYKMDLMAGESTGTAGALVKRCMLAGMAVMGTPTIAWAGGYLANSMVEGLANLSIDLNLIKTFFVMPGTQGLALQILCLVFLAGAALLMVQRFVMIGEFTLLMVVGPIMGISLLRNESQGTFQTWLREVASLLLTPVLQLLITYLFVSTFARASAFSVESFFTSFSYLFLLFKTPRWARTWMYSGGGGDGMVAGGQAVTRHLMMQHMMRAVSKGG